MVVEMGYSSLSVSLWQAGAATKQSSVHTGDDWHALQREREMGVVADILFLRRVLSTPNLMPTIIIMRTLTTNTALEAIIHFCPGENRGGLRLFCSRGVEGNSRPMDAEDDAAGALSSMDVGGGVGYRGGDCDLESTLSCRISMPYGPLLLTV